MSSRDTVTVMCRSQALRFVDLDVQLQGNFFLDSLFRVTRFALGGVRLIGNACFRFQSPLARSLLVLQGFLVVVLACVCHVDLLPARNWISPAKPVRSYGTSSQEKKKERVMGFEPTTTTLATSCSTN